MGLWYKISNIFKLLLKCPLLENLQQCNINKSVNNNFLKNKAAFLPIWFLCYLIPCAEEGLYTLKCQAVQGQLFTESQTVNIVLILILIFIDVYMCLCVYMLFTYRCPHRQKKVSDPRSWSYKSGCELPGVGSGNWTQVWTLEEQ